MKSTQKIQKVKIKDLINFLYCDQNLYKEYIKKFQEQRNEVKRLVPYIFEFIWNYPKIIEYLNKYNIIYFNEDPIKFLEWLRYIFQDNPVLLKSNFFNYNEALQSIKKLEEESLKTQRQLIDVLAEIKLAQVKGEQVKLHQHKKVNKKDSQEIKEKIKETYENIKQTQINKVLQKTKIENNRYLTELNENLIEELQLTLIDIYTDKKRNKLIYIFIDKDSNKKYYITDFKVNFYISKNTKIFENDYLEKINENKFIKYSLYNYWDFNKIKSEINKNYEKNIKLDL